MKTFTNLFGTKITYRPFFQKSINTWRIARYENNKLDMVFENSSFNTFDSCLKAIK